jgi:protein-S-isoprenylcysteine O-methyltransferase Ste14
MTPMDPFSQLTARIPEWMWKIVGITIFTIVLSNRLTQYHDYSSPFLFALETAVPATILAAYLTRPAPKEPARGWKAVLLPLFASVLPLSLILAPTTRFGRLHQPEIMVLLCIFTATMVWGYMSLNRSFAVMAEARELRQAGAYRFVRHPVYASQLACGLVVLLWRHAWWSVPVWLVFFWAQNTRAREEEAVLTRAFPEYAEYVRTTSRFFPGLY